MLEFKVIENLKSNKDLTNILKDFKYKVILLTNLQVIPTEYQIIYLTTLTILEYKVNEILNNKEHNQKYNIIEITQFLKKF